MPAKRRVQRLNRRLIRQPKPNKLNSWQQLKATLKDRKFKMTLSETVLFAKKFGEAYPQDSRDLISKALLLNGFQGDAKQFVRTFFFRMGNDGLPRWVFQEDRVKAVKRILAGSKAKKVELQKIIATARQTKKQLETLTKELYGFSMGPALHENPNLAGVIRHDICLRTTPLVKSEIIQFETELRAQLAKIK